MKKFTKNSIKRVFVLFLVFGLVLGLSGSNVAHAATAPDLGVATGYSVFGNAGITETVAQLSNLWGNAGGNGFGHASLIASQVDGAIDAGANAPVVGAISTAYGDLAGEAQTGAIDLATSPTVTPGVYNVGATAFNSTLTLNGAGVYIFRSTSSIAQTAGGTMVLTNGACASDVFWQIPTSMTFAAAGTIEGTIITNTGLISFVSGVNLRGRAWAATQVTMDNNQITEPTTCGDGGSVHKSSSPQPTPILFPLINVTKIPSPLDLPLGPGPVTFTYTVTNIGIIPMYTIKVTDSKCRPIQFISGDSNSDARLDVGESWVYRCTKTVSETETNVVTAQGSTDNAVVRDTASATVVVGAPVVPPLIHLVKVPNLFLLPAEGGAVTYNYTVTNPGTEPLSDVFITDDKCTGLPGRVVGHPGDLNKNNLLERNEVWSFTCQTNLTQTTTNIGTAEGHANGLTAFDYSSATVVVATAVPVFPKLPKTGFSPQEKSATLPIAVLAGLSLFSIVLYFARRKHTT